MKKRKIILLSTIVIISIIIILLILSYFTFSLEVKGKDKITIPLLEKYQDEGCFSKVLFFNNSCKTIYNNLDINNVGTYKITYLTKWLFFEKEVKRTIKVIDNESPTITLNGSEEISLYQNDIYNEPGYNVFDNYDEDLYNKIIVESNLDTSKVGEYIIKYKVSDSSGNTSLVERKIIIKEKKISNYKPTSFLPTYINGILIVNKTYHLPQDYNPGVDSEAYNSLTLLQQEASNNGYSIPLLSSFRSYSYQKTLYNNYVLRDGEEMANTYSAKPGQSEHQTGLAFDVGKLDDNYGKTQEGIWLKENAHHFGFIIRYLEGKEHITGYQYEPWHIRYVGKVVAKEIYEKNITLEEYLNLV